MPKSSAIDPYLGYYESVSCHWSSAGRKGFKYYGVKEGGEMRLKQTTSSSVVVNTCRRHRKGTRTCKHSQVTVRATPHVTHTHTCMHIGKGMPSEPADWPSDSTGKIDFSLSLSLVFFFFPGGAGQVFNLTL